MNQIKTKRLPEISYMFCFTMVLVVNGHANIPNDPAANPEWFFIFRGFTRSFQMHLFLFISGFLFIHTHIHKEFSWIQLMRKKIKRLLVPYFVLLSLAYLPRVYLSQWTDGKFTFSFLSYLKMFVNPHYSVMYNYWFIFTVFVFFIFGGYCLYLVKNKRHMQAAIVTAALAIISIHKIEIDWLCLNYITGYFIYFFLGCLFYHCKSNIDELNDKLWGIIFFIVILMINVFHLDIPNVFIRLSGIMFAYFLILAYKRSSYRFFVFNFMEGYTYPIYLLSWFFHNGTTFFLNKQMGLGFYIVYPISLSSAIIFPVLIAKLLENKFPKYKHIVGI